MPTVAERIAEKEVVRAEYILAQSHLLKGGQAYSIGNRSLTRADLKFVAERIRIIDGELTTLRRGNQIVSHKVVPRDI